ncbi:MAG: hypothetical protein KDC95_05095 [Planctomycetes bacterium]|nr:hypothetical protein [Planctomycetota bacterium]
MMYLILASFMSAVWTTAAYLAVMAILGGILRFFADRGRYPRLEYPDPEFEPVATAHDRRRYYLANLCALVVGIAVGALLWWTSPANTVPALWRVSMYDDRGGRLLGPFFLMLAAGCYTVPWFADRLVEPGPLRYILWQSASRMGLTGLDLRPVMRATAWIIGGLAILMHYAMRSQHTTMTTGGVTYRDWPWESEIHHAWKDVKDIRIVRTFEAMTGSIVARPHLGIEFVGGDVMHVGRRMTMPLEFWVEAAKIASEKSGVAVRHVERD